MIVAVVVNMVYEEGHVNAQRFAFFDLVHGDGLRMNQNRTNAILYRCNFFWIVNINAALF